MDEVIVIKIGGIAIENLSINELNQIYNWQKNNIKIVIVHGGGVIINQTLKDYNHKTKKIEGIRVTTSEDIPLIYDALIHKVGLGLTNHLKTYDINAFQVIDNLKHLSTSTFLDKDKFGYVGQIKKVNIQLLKNIMINNQIPVIASLSYSVNNEWFNINADYLATAIAQALKANQLILMTDVQGIMENKKLHEVLSIEQALEKINEGIIKDGMIPKVESAIQTIRSGVKKVLIGNNLDSGTIIRGEVE